MTGDGDWERMIFLPAAAVAQRLHVSVKAVRADCRTGVIPAVKVGGDWRVPEIYLHELVSAAYARAGREYGPEEQEPGDCYAMAVPGRTAVESGRERDGETGSSADGPPSFVSVSATACALGMHRKSVLRLIGAGVIPAQKIGERWYVPTSFFARLETEAYAA